MTSPRSIDGTRERSLGFALGELVRIIRRDFLRRAAEYRLTPELWRLLYCLDREQGCSQRHLADILGLTPVTLGRMVDRLQERGLVRRVADPADRRALRLFLTPAAAAPIGRMHALVEDSRARAMRGLRSAEQAEFWRLLGHIRANLAEPAPRSGRGRQRGR